MLKGAVLLVAKSFRCVIALAGWKGSSEIAPQVSFRLSFVQVKRGLPTLFLLLVSEMSWSSGVKMASLQILWVGALNRCPRSFLLLVL